MLLLITECNFTRKETFAETFSNSEKSKIFQKRLPMKQYNNLVCRVSQNSFSKTLHKQCKISLVMSFGISARMQFSIFLK